MGLLNTVQWEKKKVNAVILAWFQILVLSLSGSVSFEKWFTALSLRFLIYKMRVTFRVMVKIVPTAIFWSSSSPKHLSPFPRIQSLRQSLYEYTLLKPQRCKSGSKRRVKQKRRENESRKCVIKLAMASHYHTGGGSALQNVSGETFWNHWTSEQFVHEKNDTSPAGFFPLPVAFWSHLHPEALTALYLWHMWRDSSGQPLEKLG